MQHEPNGALPIKDLVSIAHLTSDDIHKIFATALAFKAGNDDYSNLLRGKRLGMIFEKESLRTRFTFDIGIQDLGGSAVFLDHRDARLGSRESVMDMAKNLERWVHCIVARTYKHKAVTDLAKNAGIPVINGLSDYLHPCQALADFMTLTEKWGDVRGKTLTYVGDGNNTCHSLIHTAAKLGVNIRVCTPESYEPNSRVVRDAESEAAANGSEVVILNDPREAVDSVDAVYTDVWASMGQEDEREERASIFADYKVDEEMMALTNDAFFMHCLPAHRGHEVTAAVIDGPSSIVFDIAENRLHAQKAVMALLMTKEPIATEVTA
jgi:ornithine carbamoyltransferase